MYLSRARRTNGHLAIQQVDCDWIDSMGDALGFSQVFSINTHYITT